MSPENRRFTVSGAPASDPCSWSRWQCRRLFRELVGLGNKSPRGASGAGASAGTLLNVVGSSAAGGPVYNLGGSDSPPVGPCVGDGWRCKIPDCTGKSPTTVRATVYDPAASVETGSASYKAGGSFPPATELWGSLAAMKSNDILLMACSGTDDATRRGITAANKADLKTYLDGGGRVFLEHYHDTWLRGGNESPLLEDEQKYQTTPFPAMATWLPADEPDYQAGHPGAFASYTVDVSFPKGKDFADWLQFVGASPKGLGTIDLYGVKHPTMATLPPSRAWISDATGVPYFSFNTPLEATPEAQCGRVVHTGIHVGVEKLTDDDHGPFPGACASKPMTAQEKALEFLALRSLVLRHDHGPAADAAGGREVRVRHASALDSDF